MCQTQLQRRRAERLILQTIGERVLSSPTWREKVLAETQTAWQKIQQTLPAELQEVEQRLAEVNRKIEHLLDQVEAGHAPPELHERLASRRAEREQLLRRRQQLIQTQEACLPEPTAAWVVEQFRHLQEIMATGGPAAAHALRALVGGAIEVHEIRAEGKRRFYWQGRFRIVTASVLRCLSGPGEQVPTTSGLNEEIVIDFREATPAEAKAEEVHAMWERGLEHHAIARQFGCGRALVTKALEWWHRLRGLEPPDGRSCKARLDRPDKAEELAEQAKELWDEGLLMHEIAAKLHCCHDTATRAIQHWFESRGLPVPDGRTRRKSLVRKSGCAQEGDAAPNERRRAEEQKYPERS